MDEHLAAFCVSGGRVHMQTLELGPSPGPAHLRRPKVNWQAVAAVTAIAIALASFFGSGASGVGTVMNRLQTLETQRVEDQRRLEQIRADDARWRERLENKVDRLLERRQ